MSIKQKTNSLPFLNETISIGKIKESSNQQKIKEPFQQSRFANSIINPNKESKIAFKVPELNKSKNSSLDETINLTSCNNLVNDIPTNQSKIFIDFESKKDNIDNFDSIFFFRNSNPFENKDISNISKNNC